MNLLENILYINLDYRVDRKQHLLEEFRKLGINENGLQRFSAIKTKLGNIGCTMSHIKCLELAKEKDYPYIFVCEDDITFTNPQILLENLNKMTMSNIHWDVLVIGGNTCPPFQPITDYCIRVFNVQTTTGYIVRKNYYDILIQNFREGLYKLLKDPENLENKKQYSIDIYWKQLQQRDTWVIFIPLTVTQYYDYSDIEGKVVEYSKLMLDLEKKELIEFLMKQEQEKKNTHKFMM